MQACHCSAHCLLGVVCRGHGLGFHHPIQLHHPSLCTHIVTYLLVCLIAEDIVYMFHIDSILINVPVQEIAGNVIVQVTLCLLWDFFG